MKYLLLSIITFFALQRVTASVYDESLRATAEALVINLENRGVERIIISDLTSTERPNAKLSQRISEELVIHILNYSTSLKVYERKQLNAVLEELKLQNSGLVNDATTQKAGELLGAEAIITGNFTVERDEVKVWLKAIEVNSGLKIAAATCHIESYPRSLLHSKTDTKPFNSKNEKRGDLILKNKTSRTILIKVYSSELEKEVYLGRFSKNQLLDLPAGKYKLTATYKTHSEPFFSSEVHITSRKTKQKIKGVRSLFDQFMENALVGI
ncbi:MAG: CsgG/HfaB family protein [Flavobacteriales bacterium]